jgi:hypothetical protein
VVKGTVFTVTVRPDGGALQVTEGAVQVASLASGEVALVRPGQIAQIPSGPVGRMIILDRGQSFRAPPPDRKAKSIAAATPSPAGAKSLGKADAAPAKDARAPQGRVVALAINRVIGAQKLDVAKATKGLVTPASAPNGSAGKAKPKNEVADADDGKTSDDDTTSNGKTNQEKGKRAPRVAVVAAAVEGRTAEVAKSDASTGAGASLGSNVGGGGVSVATEPVAIGAPSSAAPAPAASAAPSPVTTAVSTAVAPVTSTVPTVTAPVSSTVTTVVAPVTSTVPAVTAPVVTAVQPVVSTILTPVAGASSDRNGNAFGLLKK